MKIIDKEKRKKTIEPAANNQIIQRRMDDPSTDSTKKKRNETLTTLKIKRGEHHFQKNGIETKILKKRILKHSSPSRKKKTKAHINNFDD